MLPLTCQTYESMSYFKEPQFEILVETVGWRAGETFSASERDIEGGPKQAERGTKNATSTAALTAHVLLQPKVGTAILKQPQNLLQ